MSAQRDAFDRAIAAWNAADLDTYLELSDEGIALHGCSFTMHGTHNGELAGIPASGRRIQQPGVTILRFEGDKVVERHSIADFEAVIAQITAD